MRFRVRTFPRRTYRRKRSKKGRGLPYSKNNKIYYGQGVISKVLAGLVAKLGDSILGI